MIVNDAIAALRNLPGNAEIEGIDALVFDEKSGKVKIEKVETPKKVSRTERSTDPENG